MKTVGVHEAKQFLSAYVARAQKEDVLILKNGKPAALVVGVEGQDLEDMLLQRNRKFWKMIEKSRSQPAVYTIEQVRQELGLRSPTPKKKKGRRLQSRRRTYRAKRSR